MIIVYHADCCDGFTAAWVLHKKYPDATFIAARYDELLEPLPGEHYIFVDFCFKRAVMEQFLAVASSLLVLDHHKTAAEDMVGFPNCIFGMNKSGARIAWEFYGGTPARRLDNYLVAYVEDRDLWRHALESTKAINAVIQSCEKTFSAWDRLDVGITFDFRTIVGQGQAILRAQRSQLDYLKKLARPNRLDLDYACYANGTRAALQVPFVNSPVLVSELLNELCVGHPYAVAYHMLSDGRWKYSLRSDALGVDVSEVAKRYPGGGGHAHAAGFTSQLGPQEV